MAENNNDNRVATTVSALHSPDQEIALSSTKSYTPQTTGLVSAWSSSSSSAAGTPPSSPLQSRPSTPTLPPSSPVPIASASPRLPQPLSPPLSEPKATRELGAPYFRALPKPTTRACRKRGRFKVSHAQRPRRTATTPDTHPPTVPGTPSTAAAPPISFNNHNGQIGKVRTSGTIGLSLAEFNTRLIELYKCDLNEDGIQGFPAQTNEFGETCARDPQLDENWVEVYAWGRCTVEGDLNNDDEV